MKSIDEIEEACERAAEMQNRATRNGSKYPGMTYEDGLREAFDWICGNEETDPTQN